MKANNEVLRKCDHNLWYCIGTPCTTSQSQLRTEWYLVWLSSIRLLGSCCLYKLRGKTVTLNYRCKMHLLDVKSVFTTAFSFIYTTALCYRLPSPPYLLHNWKPTSSHNVKTFCLFLMWFCVCNFVICTRTAFRILNYT